MAVLGVAFVLFIVIPLIASLLPESTPIGEKSIAPPHEKFAAQEKQRQQEIAERLAQQEKLTEEQRQLEEQRKQEEIHARRARSAKDAVRSALDDFL